MSNYKKTIEIKNNVVLFPSYRIGLKPGDHTAIVSNIDGRGKARYLKLSPESEQELPVFAHNDLIISLREGDWVRICFTIYGPIVLERLAQPGERPLPRAEYINGRVYIDQNDPAWRLYDLDYDKIK